MAFYMQRHGRYDICNVGDMNYLSHSRFIKQGVHDQMMLMEREVLRTLERNLQALMEEN